MTIEGAIVQLQELIDNDEIPFWAKPGLQKIMETVEMEREQRIEAQRHQYITQAVIKVDFSEEDKKQLVKEIVENLKHEKVICIPNEYAQDATTCGKCAYYDRQFSYCDRLGVTFADDDFCSYFKQKEEKTNAGI